MIDEELHILAREYAKFLTDPDKKQLRYNEIVEASKKFYNLPHMGIKELVESCDKSKKDIYVKNNPMWKSLQEDYGWMIYNEEEPIVEEKTNWLTFMFDKVYTVFRALSKFIYRKKYV